MALKRIGNWAKALMSTKKVGKLMLKHQQKFLDETAEKGLELLQGHINNGDLPWRPLSPRYVEQKQNQGYQQEIYIRSRKFYDSLTIKNIEKSGRFIGIPNGIQTDEGERMVDIAKIHEFGALSVGIFERPLFRPTMEELVTWAKNQKPAKKVLDELKSL